MRSVAATASELAQRLGHSKAAGWDPVGLQFGDPAAAVSRVAVCHEITPAVADQIVELGIDLVVAYHPLLFRPVTSLVAGDTAAGLAHRLITHRAALVVVHTAFDVKAGGTADQLAQAIGLEEVQGFGPAWGRKVSKVITFVPEPAVDAVADAMAHAGAGQIGAYTACSYRSTGIGTFRPGIHAAPSSGIREQLNREPEHRLEMISPEARVDDVVAALVAAHPYEEPAFDVVETRSNAGFIGRRGRLPEPTSVADLAALADRKLGSAAKVAGAGKVSSVAVIPGSGGSFLPVAGAEVVVTGDVTHHQARAALAAGNRVIDPGHAATERPGVQALYAAVNEMIDATVDLTHYDPDPWTEH
jgi:dinuclear metal center YbgI/SA1388 family protein